jgi:hypothetical protein
MTDGPEPLHTSCCSREANVVRFGVAEAAADACGDGVRLQAAATRATGRTLRARRHRDAVVDRDIENLEDRHKKPTE